MKNERPKFYFLLILLLGSTALLGQILEVTNSAPITPENLISNVFLGDGVEVINISYEGDDSAVGLFTNGLDDIGMERGIVMTTGQAVTAGAQIGVNSPGTAQASQTNNSDVEDADLQSIIGDDVSLNDVSKYTIQFIPTNDTLQFTYSFASEEYPEFVCSEYNDVFGFFISGPGFNGPYENGAKNIALIPGTNRPVTINNVNPGQVGTSGMLSNCQGADGSLAFSQYYNNNLTSSFPVYDGYTDVLVAQAIVMPCSVYTIKLIIGDVSDGGWDSGVFLEAKSFGTGSLEVEIDGLAVDGGLAEGCAIGEITFTLPEPAESPYDVELEVGGTAEAGVDYPPLPPNIIIPEGDSTFSIFLSAFDDDIVEDDETIVISVKRDACNRDTFTIVVKDNILEKPDLGPDLTVCPTDETLLDGMVDVPLPDPLRFENTTPLLIDEINTPFISEIEVFGVLPIELGPEAILSICIDSLEHRWIDDLDIFLVAPGGQFIELTTDNGADGDNGLGIDNYLGTCFTIDASTPINFPGPLAPGSAAPFTGNWQPEGVWSDLWDGDNPTNGTWQLVVTDDTQGVNGTLFSWSITFNAVYQIDYNWEPALDLSCADCPDPVASPDVSTTYELIVTDSYGCIERDTIDFNVLPALPMSELMCGVATTSSVQVFWEDVVGITGYEVSVDGGPWVPANDVLAHNVDGLGLSQDVEIIVRGLADCPSFPDTIICRSLDCTPATLSASPTPASCFSGDDGSVQINVLSGTAPFVYELNGDSNNTGQFNGLEAGTYMAMVTDGDGCTGPVEFIVDEPIGPVFNLVTEQSLNCNGDANGALTVEVENGNGPFVFNWDNMTSDSIATNLVAGSYNLQLTDMASCVYEVDFLLEEPVLLEATIEGDDVLCAGTNTGQAWVIPSGGTGSYTYLWSDGQLQDTAFLLAVGMHEAIVTDSLNCTFAIEVDLQEPMPVTLNNAMATPTLCNGEATGSISVEVAGGTMPYETSWTNQLTGEVVGDQNIVMNLYSGDYDLMVTDANGCTEGLSLNVNEPNELELFNLQIEIPTCVGLEDGIGEIEVQGGVQPYDIIWDSGSIGLNSNNLAAANHWVAVEDSNGCVDTMLFILNAPEAITLALSAEPVSCFGFSDGIALVEAQGGAMPYTISWNGAVGPPLAENLSAGNQIVSVLDANNCLAEGDIDVLSPTLLEVSLSGVNPSCFGEENGSALATSLGGTMPYSYEWNDGQMTEEAINLGAQTISTVVTDANACTAMATINLTEPDALSITTSAQEQACAGPPNGQAVVNPSGGTMPYSFAWDNGQSSQTASGLITGDYSVTVTDGQACTIEANVNVPMAETVSIANFSVTNVSCNGGNDGSVDVELTGGTAPFTWSEPITSLEASSYSLTVTDANSCTDVLQVQIEEPAALMLNTDITHVVCAGEQSGALDLSVTGGTMPYSYSWNTGLVSEDINNLLSANYTVSVTDAMGCIESLESTVNEATQLNLTSDFTDVNCFGYSTGSISIETSGGEAPYTYAWSNGQTVSQQEMLRAGNYILTVTDTYGCEIMESFTINEPDELLASFTTQDVSCNGGGDGLIKIEGSGGTQPFRYRYNNSFWQASPTFIGLKADAYSMQLEDANGCTYGLGIANVTEPPLITIDLGGDRDIRFGDSLSISPIVIGLNEIISYQWINYDSTWMQCADCIEQVVFPSYTSDLFLLVKDENGCTSEEWIRIRVSKNFPVQVATGFTPNGDFTNDLLMVHGLPGVKVLTFQVWDRWGEMVYEQGDFDVNNEQVGWDGSFRGQTMNGGVYVWKIEVLLPDGKTEQLAGQTTLIR